MVIHEGSNNSFGAILVVSVCEWRGGHPKKEKSTRFKHWQLLVIMDGVIVTQAWVCP